MAAVLLPPLQPVTAAQYAETPETPDHRYELQEGAILMIPGPGPDHQATLMEIYDQLRSQVPQHLVLLAQVDLDLHLVPPAHPGTVRVPDLVVVTREAFLRVRREGGLLRADETLLAVEVLSGGTRRNDTVVKHAEYADAGIGHYWMVDLLNGPSLTASHHGGAFGYVNDAPVSGTFTTDAPFAVRLELDQLG